MRSLTARALAVVFAGAAASGSCVSCAFAAAGDAYEILFDQVLAQPGDVALNKRFAYEAESRGDLRHAFAALERVVLSSPGDTQAQAEFDRVRNKLKPSVTLVTVEGGASYVSNPRQLASSGSVLDEYNVLASGNPFSLDHRDDATFDAKLYVADERMLGPFRWRSFVAAKAQFQAVDTGLNTQTIAVDSGPVFQLDPNIWLHVAGGGEMAWLNESKLYDDARVSATIGGLYRGLTQSVTARYTWRSAHLSVGQLDDLDGVIADPKADSANIFDLEGRFVVSPKLATGDLFYFRPHLQVSRNDADPSISIPQWWMPYDTLVLQRPLFPGNFTQLGAAVSYYYPLWAGRAFIGAGLEFYQRWYNESASSLDAVGICTDVAPWGDCWSAELVDVQAGKRRDSYLEPTAHLIFPNYFASGIDLRFDYRYEQNDSNASTTTVRASDDSVVNLPLDFRNHVAGVHVIGRF